MFECTIELKIQNKLTVAANDQFNWKAHENANVENTDKASLFKRFSNKGNTSTDSGPQRWNRKFWLKQSEKNNFGKNLAK